MSRKSWDSLQYQNVLELSTPSRFKADGPAGANRTIVPPSAELLAVAVMQLYNATLKEGK